MCIRDRFEHLVDQQYFSATFLKLVGEVNKAVTGEIKVVHIDEQTGMVGSEFLFGVLDKESCFSYATFPFDTNQTVTPVNLVHKIAANGGIGCLLYTSHSRVSKTVLGIKVLLNTKNVVLQLSLIHI